MNFMVPFLTMTLVYAEGPTLSTVPWQQRWGVGKEERGQPNPVQCQQASDPA